MLSIKDNKSKKLEAALTAQLKKDLNEEIANEDELFVLADYDETAAEKEVRKSCSSNPNSFRNFSFNIKLFSIVLLRVYLSE